MYKTISTFKCLSFKLNKTQFFLEHEKKYSSDIIFLYRHRESKDIVQCFSWYWVLYNNSIHDF